MLYINIKLLYNDYIFIKLYNMNKIGIIYKNKSEKFQRNFSHIERRRGQFSKVFSFSY